MSAGVAVNASRLGLTTPSLLPPRIDTRRDHLPVAGTLATSVLIDLVDRQRQAQDAVDDEIDRLLAHGVSRPAIAEALGVSRQAARQRWLRRHS